MIERGFIEQTKEELAYERKVLSIWQRFKLAVWRWRATEAFDERDRCYPNSSEWHEANAKVERLFK